MVDTVEPVVARTALSATHRQLHVDGGAALLNWIPSGFAVTDGGGLNADIAAGRAFLDGAIADRDVATTGQALTASSTNHVFVYIDDILDDGVVYFEINTSGTPPTEGPSHKLAEVTTDGAGVTGVTDFRRLIPELTGGLTLGGDLEATSRVKSAAGTHLSLLGAAGNIVAESVLRPNTHDARDLGLTGTRWRDLYLQGILFLGSNLQLTEGVANRLDLSTGNDLNLVLGDILMAASRTVDGVDVSDHSGRHDAAGADAMAIDAIAATGSLRTLGNGAQQAAQGSAFADHDARHEPGGADPMEVDAVVGTGSLRTLGLGAQQAVAGTTFGDHNARHEPGGADPMAVDQAAATASLRTLGGGAAQAAAGDHAHSDVRTISKGARELEAETGSPTEGIQSNLPSWALDEAASERITGGFEMPQDFDGSTAVTIKVIWRPSNTNAGNVRFQAIVRGIAAGESMTGGGSTLLLTQAAGASTSLQVTELGTIAASNFAVDDWVRIRLARLGGDGADTYGFDIYVFGVVFEYTAA